MEQKPERVRVVSNILYEEVKKHKDNRHLNYVFDNDFVSKQQERCYSSDWNPNDSLLMDLRTGTSKSGAILHHWKTKYNWRYQRNLGLGLQPEDAAVVAFGLDGDGLEALGGTGADFSFE